jgi:toxin ParE1/3/4
VRALLFSPKAQGDIDAIWEYSADHWGVDQADRYVTALRDTCAALARDERTGRDASDIRPGYRKIQSGRHVIFYGFDERGALEVVRILHERMDVRARLEEGEG